MGAKIGHGMGVSDDQPRRPAHPAVQQKYADVAKAYSIAFSPKFQTDRNKLWYEKVAGTPPPA